MDISSRYYDADGDLYTTDLVGDIAKAAKAEGLSAKVSGDRIYIARDGRPMGFIEVDGDVNLNNLKNKAGIRDTILPHIS